MEHIITHRDRAHYNTEIELLLHTEIEHIITQR